MLLPVIGWCRPEQLCWSLKLKTTTVARRPPSAASPQGGLHWRSAGCFHFLASVCLPDSRSGIGCVTTSKCCSLLVQGDVGGWQPGRRRPLLQLQVRSSRKKAQGEVVGSCTPCEVVKLPRLQRKVVGRPRRPGAEAPCIRARTHTHKLLVLGVVGQPVV